MERDENIFLFLLSLLRVIITIIHSTFSSPPSPSSSDMDDPESIVRAPATIRSSSLARFSFGPPRGLWQRLSIFLTSTSGEFYALCPILPIGALVPAKLLVELRFAAEMESEELTRAMHELEEDEVETSMRRAAWAREVQGRKLAQV